MRTTTITERSIKLNLRMRRRVIGKALEKELF
jgi:hypothetical protein